MSDHEDPSTVAVDAGSKNVSAGALLRQAREKRGLHIAALAASIKVLPRKLEALEADRYEELPDITFARALASTVCRALKVDAAPVLERMPQMGDATKLARVGGGLNTPYRDRPGRSEPNGWSFVRRPVFWATLAVLLAAAVLALLPDSLVDFRSAPGPVALPASAVAVPASAAGSTSLPLAGEPATVAASSPAVETVFDAPPAGATAVPIPGAGPAGVLVLRASGESWIEVQDAAGLNLLSRTVLPGETVGLDGALPLRVKIGNAAATQLSFRGQPVDLAAVTRDNVARLELK